MHLEEDDVAESSTTTVETPKHKQTKKRRHSKSEDYQLDKAFQILNSCALKETDGSQAFGNFVANKLRTYDELTRMEIQHQITSIFLQTDKQQHYLKQYKSIEVLYTEPSVSTEASVSTPTSFADPMSPPPDI